MTDEKDQANDIPEIQNIEPVPEDSLDASGPVHTGRPLSHSGARSPSGAHSAAGVSRSQATEDGGRQKRKKKRKEDPNLGKVLKQTYRLVKKVGEGGMGDVYKAIQAPLEREVAVKLLKPTETNPEGEHYFMREVQAINMLRHPNIINIVDFGKEADGTLFLVMEYLPGQTLKRAIRKEYPLQVKRVCNICVQTLSALEQAHQSDIVHCDLKPANIMLERVAGQDDFVKVLDFGIAKVKNPGMEAGPYTQAGNIVGTFDYMSPEQIMRKDLDGRADLWSMGVILYEMLTKERIFHDKDAVSIIGRVMQMPITPPIEALEPGSIPQELNDIVMKAMERNVERRFQSAAEMRQALQQLLAHMEAGGGYQVQRQRRLEDTGPSGVHSQSLARSGMLKSGVTSPSGPLSGSGSPTGATGSSSIVSRSGGFGTMLGASGTMLGESQRLRTGIEQGTSVLDQTFNIDALQDSLLGERRRVAVLAIQQRAQKGVDPEERARRSRQEHQLIAELVEHYDGEIDNQLGGTFTIMFGATRARVGDNMRALECALALKERFQLLEQGSEHIGLGVTYDEVFIASRKGGNAYGDAIDRCVELGRSATEAQVLVDEEMVKLTRQQVEYDAAIMISGEPAHELMRVREQTSEAAEEDIGELQAVDVYVPRPVYFDELVRRAQAVKQSQGGGVAIVGEAGVGKSTLIDRFAQGRDKAGWQVFTVRAHEIGPGQQLGVLRHWIRQVASTYKNPSELIRKACRSIGLRDRLEAVVRLFSEVDGARIPPERLPFQDQNARAHFTSSLFHRMMRFAVRKGPVLFVFDGADVHDQLTMEFFDSLLPQLGKFKVLVALTARLEIGQRGRLSGNFEVLRVEGFEQGESRQFISQLVGFMPSPQVIAQLHERASGNPMFLEEMLRALARRGGLQSLSDGASVLETGIPLNLQELLAQRIDDLPDQLRDLLAVASVLGESFREEFFYQITPAHLGPQMGLEELVAQGLFEARQDPFGRIVVGFNPRALRKVVYDRIPKSTRRQIHASVIEFLEQTPDAAAVDVIDVPLMLAFHYRSVEGHEGAAHYLTQVGEILLDMYDYDGAVQQFEDALELIEGRVAPTEPLWLGAQVKLLTSLRESGQIEQAQVVIDQMPELEEIPEEFHAELLLEIGQVGMEGGGIGRATEALFRVVELAQQAGDIKLEVKGRLALAQLFEKENQLQRAINLLVEVSGQVEQIGDLNLDDPDDRRLFWTAYNQLGTLCIRQKQIQQALQYLKQAMERAQQIQDHRGLLRVVSNMGALFLNVRDIPNAIKYFQQALELAKATGDRLNESRIRTNMGIAAMEGNDLEASKKHFLEARRTAEEIGWYEGLADLSLHIKRLRQMLHSR